VVTPADPVQVRSHVGSEIASAVRSALDNVTDHCPPRTPTWVVVEEDGGTIVVTVRDTGPGIPDGRVDEAKTEGRLGISQSIRGRIHDLGGTVTVTSEAGQGTEVEMRVPGAT
jgi:signal transduction histidine kinase